MTSYFDLKDFFKSQKIKVIMAADGETRITEKKGGLIIERTPAGGVSVALDPIAKASSAVYVTRGRTEEERKLVGSRMIIKDVNGEYTLKRLFLNEEEIYNYSAGFSNQTLWPLCHIAFQLPEFHKNWYEGFKKVNQKFTQSIREEIRGRTFIWINDYQLSLVPKYLGKPKNTIVAMFWHIPWPTWEIFRILPYKKELLESLLNCDFLAFHRGYQARNFLNTVERELEVRIDQETNTVYYNQHATTVQNLPLGIDTDAIESLVKNQEKVRFRDNAANYIAAVMSSNKHKVILGIDRLDYTKGLKLRMMAIDRFFERHKEYVGKVVYFGILAPSREKIPAYINLKKEVVELAKNINKKYGNKNWQPIHLSHDVYPRDQVMNFYKKANLCLVTPLDDGMNLVSKEFVVASYFASDPGMLVLSQFAGSAIDLTQSLIVNPYNIDEVVSAIKRGLEMSKQEKIKRIKAMKETLDERNMYQWAQSFVRNAIEAVKEKRS